MPISPGLHFLVCDKRNQNQQTEMFKKGVDSTIETRKWASATLVWSPKPWISCGPPPVPLPLPHPLPPSPLNLMATLPSYQKTYLLCTISLEGQCSCEKKHPKFPLLLRSFFYTELFKCLLKCAFFLLQGLLGFLLLLGLGLCFQFYLKSRVIRILKLYSLKNVDCFIYSIVSFNIFNYEIWSRV